ncbi:hypothetical protein [Knoellia koreensis]|uniref:Uncharacterized protein n=1 Tax=Knoellia koreensis TaxID=2730921 RepID=A0A849HAK4_9MICO|nr:hypothetical protein [Knoellia sp. DB2414S]NNM44392.1 hypothetical protein [Knoellia sp. DB2414S]
MTESYFIHILKHEMTDYERAEILQAARRRPSGRHYLTFNVFNVLMDFDSSTATVEDELDVDSAESLPLDEFLSAVAAWGDSH